MRKVFLVIAVDHIIGCDPHNASIVTTNLDVEDSLVERIWSLEDIEWRTDTLRDGENVVTATYAGVPSLYFTPHHRFKMIRFLAYKDNRDTVHAGAEPSRTVYLGTWKHSDSVIIVSYKLVEKDMPMVHEKVPGDLMTDTVKFVGDGANGLSLKFRGEFYGDAVLFDKESEREVKWFPKDSEGAY